MRQILTQISAPFEHFVEVFSNILNEYALEIPLKTQYLRLSLLANAILRKSQRTGVRIIINCCNQTS